MAGRPRWQATRGRPRQRGQSPGDPAGLPDPPQPGILQGLAPPKRSSKSRPHPREQENQKLGRQNQRLAEALRKAASIIDLQQK